MNWTVFAGLAIVGFLILCAVAYVYLLGTVVEEGMENQQTDDCKVLERIPTEDGLIEIVDEWCKEGLPHTTDSNTIRMTRQKYDSQRLPSLLVHERIHLDQKRNPTKWAEFYKQYWDYDIQYESPVPDVYAKHLRPNPDTAANPWAIWRQRWVFFPYTETGGLQAANVRIWDLFENTFVPVPEQWKARFCDADGCPHQYEHPHELSAELWTDPTKSVASAQLTRWYKAQRSPIRSE